MNFDVAILNEFDLREEHRNKLKSYYLLHWQFQYLIRKLNDDGTLTHADVTYIPIYKDSWVSMNPTTQVKLSFRSVFSMTGDRNYVLIKAL